MPFFAEIPEPEAELESGQRQLYLDVPWQAPQHWLPGNGALSVTVFRSEHTAVLLTIGEVYPRGLMLEVVALLNPEGPDVEALHHGRSHHGPNPDDLRLGLLWPDGRRAEAVSQWHGPPPQQSDDDFHLHPQGSQGGGLVWRWGLWLEPLPPPGPVEIYVRWDGREIPETSTTADLTTAVAAAADAEELWPLPTHPDDESFGWMSYSPMSSTVFAARAEEDGSGDAADAGDENG